MNNPCVPIPVVDGAKSMHVTVGGLMINPSSLTLAGNGIVSQYLNIYFLSI